MNAVMNPSLINHKKLKNFFDKHAVIAPILLNQGEERKQSVLVYINPVALTAELYYKPNPNYDNSSLYYYFNVFIGDISECVLGLLD